MQGTQRFFALLSLTVLSFWQSASADPQGGVAEEPLDQALCGIIEKAAAANGIPKGFFTRLIWRENALRLDGVSPAGAEGVAQFMPSTAAERGLANPFDSETAIPEAAKYLAELSARFGNIGLAAAGYNAGPNRVAMYLSHGAEMPAETRAYVLSITSRTIEDWTMAPAADSSSTEPPSAGSEPSKASTDDESCLAIIEAMRRATAPETVGETPFAPWGVQLAGNFSKALALAAFQRVRERYGAILGDAEPFVLGSRLQSRGASPFFRVRLPASTQIEAQRLCDRLHAAGASCIVLRS
jgi:transglycosylase-like protein with SLT domain/sporulation related protein